VFFEILTYFCFKLFLQFFNTVLIFVVSIYLFMVEGGVAEVTGMELIFMFVEINFEKSFKLFSKLLQELKMKV